MIRKYKLVPSGVMDLEEDKFIPEAPGNRDWQTYLSWIAEGNEVESWKSPEQILLELRQNAMRKVDDQAEAERQKFVTPGAGQAMTYMRKEAEARTLILQQEVEIDPTAYPILAASVAAETGMAMDEIGDTYLKNFAEAVIAKSDEWVLRAAQIEMVRLSAKRRITGAGSEEEINSILNALDWSNDE